MCVCVCGFVFILVTVLCMFLCHAVVHNSVYLGQIVDICEFIALVRAGKSAMNEAGNGNWFSVSQTA